MDWTEPKPPTEDVSYYDHTVCETPLGKFIIEWKSWKTSPDYGIMLENDYIGTEYSLEEAKEKVLEYLVDKEKELHLFLNGY